MSEILKKWFPRFPKIRSKRSETPLLPYSSSLQEVERLRALRDQPAWKHLQALWERVAQAEYDKLGAGLAYEDYLAVVGAYQAAKRTLELVDTLIAKADEYNARHRTTDDAERDHRQSIFVSGPFWPS